MDALHTYRWGTMTGEDYFCRTCGVLPFRKPSAPTASERAVGVVPFDGWAINVRCIDGIDLTSIKRLRIAGSRLAI